MSYEEEALFSWKQKIKQTLKETEDHWHGREGSAFPFVEIFCTFTDGEGGEEVGAKRVRVEGEAVINECCAEINILQ